MSTDSTWHPIQANFSAGELSPQFNAQQDSALYKHGLQRCRNAIPLSQGVATSRPGTEFITAVTEQGGVTPTDARLIPVDINASTYGVAVLAGGWCQLLSSGSFTSDEQVLTNNKFNEGLIGWRTDKPDIREREIKATRNAGTNVIRFSTNLLGYLQTMTVEQVITIPDGTSGDSVINFTFRGGQVLSGFPSPNVCIFGVGVVGGDDLLIYETSELKDGKKKTFSRTIPNTAGTSGVQLRVWGGITSFHLDYGGIVATERRNEIFLESIELLATGIVGSSSPLLAIPFLDSELDEVQYAQSPYDIATYMVHPKHPPQELVFTGAGWEFRAVPFVTQGTQPDWGPEDDKGYPAAIGAYQGRVIFANTTREPQSVWASRSGNWLDVTLETDPSASDPVWFTLTERAAIQWVHGHKQLLLGTTANEYQIRSETGLLQAGDVQADIQSSYGSTNMQPIGLGELVVVASGNKKVARGLTFSREIMGWEAGNLNWAADHILAPGARRVSNSRDPYRVAWMPLIDGGLAGMSFEPSRNIQGWHRHETDGAFVDSINVVNALSESTFFVVRRIIQGDVVFYLEKMDATYDLGELHYTDSYVIKNLGDPTTTVTGLGHLAGELVDVIVDGAVHPQVTVEGDTIELDYPGSVVEVGLPYTVSLETLPAYAPEARGGLGAKKSWPEIGVRLIDSAHPLINGVRVEERNPGTLMEQAEEGTTGQITSANRGWDDYGRILIEQDLPLSLTLAGIFGKVAVEDF